MNKEYFSSIILALTFSIGLAATPAIAANPCNPCAPQHNPCAAKKTPNPCNPCSMKKPANPCNPCAMKKHANPCNPCGMQKPANPCAMQQGKAGEWGTPGNTPIRDHAFDNFHQAVAAGKKMWNDESLGTSGMACASCHADHALLNLDKNQNYPHFVKMVGDVVTLDQMINYCMLNPMKGKPFEANSKEMTAMAAYFRAYRMQYLKEHR